MIDATSQRLRHGPRSVGLRLVRVTLLASLISSGFGCQAFDGSIIEVTVDLASDHQVLTDIHELLVRIHSGGQDATETFSTGEALTFPTSLALSIGTTRGEVSLDVRGLEESGRAVIRGLVSVEVEEVKLYKADVALGLSSTCGDGVQVTEDKDTPPEICLVRGETLVLGGGDPNLGNIANDIRIVDINDDGLPDLAAAWSNDYTETEEVRRAQSSGFSLFYGEAEAGGFRFTNEGINAKHQSHPGDSGVDDEFKQSYTDLAIADVVNASGLYQQDGNKDLLIGSYVAKTLNIWPNQGTFFDPSKLKTVELGGIPSMVRTGDVRPDVVENATTEIVVALRSYPVARSDGDKAGKLVVVATDQDAGREPKVVNETALETPVELLGFRLADLNGDGFTDIATAAAGTGFEAGNIVPGEISLGINDGQGEFTKIVVGTGHRGTRDISLLNADADRNLDIAAMNDFDGTVELYYARIPGQTYSGEPETHLIAPQGLKTLSDFTGNTKAQPECLRTGDIDGDGFEDLLLTDRVFGSIFILLLEPPSGTNGRALRFPPIRLPMGVQAGTPAAGGSLQGCDVKDTDEDGIIDLVVAVDRQDNLVQVLRRQP